MTVLNDVDIASEILRGQLIKAGDPEYAAECSYRFRAGAVMRTGDCDDDRRIEDWTTHQSAMSLYEVAPGELVWIRTLEEVTMPADICAFWWQTSALSRKGLMLVNMSMVEPGYDGFLSCLFVNFGKERVVITPDTVIAKLVFHKMSGHANELVDFRGTQPEYDRSIVEAAGGQPRTFLDLEAMSTRITEERTRAIRALEESREDAVKELRESAAEIRRATQDEIRTDTRGTALRYLGLVAAAFVLVVAAITFVPWLQSLQPSLDSQVSKDVDNSLSSHLSVSPQGGSMTNLQKQVNQLENEVKQLRQQSSAAPSG